MSPDQEDLLVDEFNDTIDALSHEVERRKSSSEFSLDALKEKLEENKQKLLILKAKKEEEWEKECSRLSWWEQLNCDPQSESLKLINKTLKDIKKAEQELDSSYRRVDAENRYFYRYFYKDIVGRLDQAYDDAEKYLNASCSNTRLDESLLKKSLFFSFMSVPVSLWDDLSTAGNVFDVLRNVNGNFSDLSDSEIWINALLLPTESLAGLISLTKGAYFEQLVSNNTGGELFEHFNHPDTDITIDGIEYQLKATDSVSYINSVDENIPIIATSEVAEQVDVIDSNITNAELTEDVKLALGGQVVDFGDTAADAALTGAISLGLLSSLKGINHALERINKEGYTDEAVFDGVGVAVENTAKSIVDLAEMIATSRPTKYFVKKLSDLAKRLDKD